MAILRPGKSLNSIRDTTKVSANNTEPGTLQYMKSFRPSDFKWEDSSAGPTITHTAGGGGGGRTGIPPPPQN